MGRYLGRYSPGTPLQAGTPLWAGTPWQVPSQVGTPSLASNPLGRSTPWQVHPQEECILGDTGNKQAVHILLECILVSSWQPVEGSFILRWQRQIKSIFFVFSCHHSVNTTTSCHDTHLFCCYCHHEWVLNPFFDVNGNDTRKCCWSHLWPVKWGVEGRSSHRRSICPLLVTSATAGCALRVPGLLVTVREGLYGCGNTFKLGLCVRTCLVRISLMHWKHFRWNTDKPQLEFHTLKSFIVLSYNSLGIYVVNMNNVVLTTSDSVLVGKTMEASFRGSFPYQSGQKSLTDIPVWDEVWEQTTLRHFCAWWPAHSSSSVSTG